MGFRELINVVKTDSGLSDEDSRDALEMMVESLAVRLNEGERKDFASQLPSELQDIALSVMPTADNTADDLIQEFMEIEEIEEDQARTWITSAWNAIKEAISPGEIRHIRAQLSGDLAAMLK